MAENHHAPRLGEGAEAGHGRPRRRPVVGDEARGEAGGAIVRDGLPEPLGVGRVEERRIEIRPEKAEMAGRMSGERQREQRSVAEDVVALA